MHRAVAVDCGATSARYALGWLDDGVIRYEIQEQIPHAPLSHGPWAVWDIDTLLALAQRARDCAVTAGAASLGIDTWGVDLGFLDAEGKLLQPPIAYRDESHDAAFAAMADHRPRLFAATGIQAQPFNTVYQLAALRIADPTFVDRVDDWLHLPDLLGYLLGAERFTELTEASTGQLVGLDGQWSPEAFAIAGWPLPARAPAAPGTLGSEIIPGVRIAHVGSHDTASAVAGFGRMDPSCLFLNMGTWTLAGAVIDHPIATKVAETAGFTNERAVDGRVRFLKNIPGFYIINRLHQELGIEVSVAEWLKAAGDTTETVNVLDARLYNPVSMVEAFVELLGVRPVDPAGWASIAMGSMAVAIGRTREELESLTGHRVQSLRVGGGGSQSAILCQRIADQTGLSLRAGPAEATVLGNLAAQFLAQGAFTSWDEAYLAAERSAAVRVYTPASLGVDNTDEA